MKTFRTTQSAGLAAVLVLGAAGLWTTGVAAADRGHDRWTQGEQGGGHRGGQNGNPGQGAQHNQWQQQRAVGRQPDRRQDDQQRAQRDHSQRQQQQAQQENARRQQAQRQQAEQHSQRQQAQRQQQHEQGQRQRQNQNQQAQRSRDPRQQPQWNQNQQAQRHHSQNNQQASRSQDQWRQGQRQHDQYRSGQQQQARNDHRNDHYASPRYNAPRPSSYHHVSRGPGWDHWRNRYYISKPRYSWSYDRRSRPWFDYNRVTYISIYRPTYVVPAYGYGSYGASYYGPVGCGRDVVGAVLGGVAGGLIGAHNGGRGETIGGAIIGAILGGTLGRAIDLSDQACYGQVLEYAPNNQPIYWESDYAQYQVTPLRTYQANSGLYCREYQTYIYIDGREEQAYGTACRQPDGAWRAVS